MSSVWEGGSGSMLKLSEHNWKVFHFLKTIFGQVSVSADAKPIEGVSAELKQN